MNKPCFEMLNHPAFLLIISDFGEKILSVSTAIENYFSLSEKSLLGKKISSLVEIPAEFTNRTSQQKSFSFYTRPDGNGTIDLHIEIQKDLIFWWIYPHSKNRNSKEKGIEKEHIAAVLSHEIRNPLTGILGAAQLIGADKEITAEDQTFLDLIQEETKRIGRLIDRFEEASIAAPIPLEGVNLHESIDLAIQGGQAGYATDMTIIRDYDPSLPKIMGSHDHLVQIFYNILKNAAESILTVHPRNEGEIRIKTRFASGVSRDSRMLPVFVSVKDNGAGISPDILPHIFTPFLTSKKKGTGLGLPIIANIIENMGGLIEAKSDETGAELQLYFPVFETKDRE